MPPLSAPLVLLDAPVFTAPLPPLSTGSPLPPAPPSPPLVPLPLDPEHAPAMLTALMINTGHST
jgi:hypothetical protein